MRDLTRREFLQLSALAALSLKTPGLIFSPRSATAAGHTSGPRALISIELLGGCDPALLGIPTDAARRDALISKRLGGGREALYDVSQAFQVPGFQVAMHPAMSSLSPYVGKMRLTMNCANSLHVEPSRSHEEAQSRMVTGSTQEYVGLIGWKARVYDRVSNARLMGFTGAKVENFQCQSAKCESHPPFVTDTLEQYNLTGSNFSAALGGSNNSNFVAQVLTNLSQTSVSRPTTPLEDTFKHRFTNMMEAIDDVSETLTYSTPLHGDYPDTDIGKRLRNVATILNQLNQTGSSDRVIMSIGHGSFDLHSNWVGSAVNIMSSLANALRVFLDDMTALGLLNNVVVTTETDFGRKVYANGTGTDHGTGFHVLTIGGRVNGGANAVYGEMISLNDINTKDAWPAAYDSRAITADLLEHFLEIDPYETAFAGPLGEQFSRHNFSLIV